MKNSQTQPIKPASSLPKAEGIAQIERIQKDPRPEVAWPERNAFRPQ